VLIVPLVSRVTSSYLLLCVAVLGVQGLVGIAGFALHLRADLARPAATLFERILSGAPPMAPLLFPNLVILGYIALFAMWRHVRSTGDQPGTSTLRSQPVQ
jgi:hypothetical protein